MRKATIAIKFEDMGWTTDIYVTTICCELKFKKRFMEMYSGNGILNIVILDWENVETLDQIDDKVNRTIIAEEW